jgi:Uma2 family endonuclease
MSIVAKPAAEIIEPPTYPLRRFTVAEYHRMAEAGILTEDDRVELLEGWVVPKMVHNPPHDATVDQAREAIDSRLPQGWRVRVQSAITTGDSEPEPDLAVVPGPAGRYRERHPGPEDVALLVEVADTSLSRDRGKRRPYARARIPVYWIINLIDSRVEVYTDPNGPGRSPKYRRKEEYGIDDSVPLVVAGEALPPIPVRELLG